MPDPRKVSGGTLLSDSGIRVVFEGEPTIVWDEHPYIALGTTPLTDYFVRFCKGWMKGRLAKCQIEKSERNSSSFPINAINRSAKCVETASRLGNEGLSME